MKSRRKFFLLKILVAVLILVLVFFMFFWDRVLVFAVRNFTECDVVYSTWRGNPLGRSVVESAEFRIKSQGVGVKAKEVMFCVDTPSLVRDHRFFMECSLSSAVFFLDENDHGEVQNILDLVSSSGQVFDNVRFGLTIEGSGLNVTSLSAGSSDITVKGDISLDRDQNLAAIDISISVSPLLASGVGEAVKNRILSLQEDGWYGASISYRGNLDFLKALYFAVSLSE